MWNFQFAFNFSTIWAYLSIFRLVFVLDVEFQGQILAQKLRDWLFFTRKEKVGACRNRVENSWIQLKESYKREKFKVSISNDLIWYEYTSKDKNSCVKLLLRKKRYQNDFAYIDH